MKRIYFSLILFIVAIYSFSQEFKISDSNSKVFNNNFYSFLYLDMVWNRINESDYLIQNWVYVDKISMTPKKVKLIDYQQKVVPELLSKLEKLSKSWTPNEQNLLSEINFMIDSLFEKQESIMDQLNSFESYDDILILLKIMSRVEDFGDISIYKTDLLVKINILRSIIYLKLDKYLIPLDDVNK